MELLILRHGETPWTISGQHTGFAEVDLTDAGRRQAQAQSHVIAEILRGREPLVLVSPRRRTRDTATLALPDVAHVIVEELAEFDYGEYEGLTTEQIQSGSAGWSIWDDGCPGGETVAEVAARVDVTLGSLTAEHRPIVAVTHGHTSRILAARCLGLNGVMGAILDTTAGSLSVLGPHHQRMTIKLWNQTPPLH